MDRPWLGCQRVVVCAVEEAAVWGMRTLMGRKTDAWRRACRMAATGTPDEMG
jgi:hypothetical protein